LQLPIETGARSKLTPAVIASITGYPFMLDALSALNTV